MKRGNNLLIYSALIAALSGLLLGFNLAVISGAEKSIQMVFRLNVFWHGFTVAIAIFGAVIGSLIAGKPADIYGRKQLLIVIAFLFFVSGIGAALSMHWGGLLFYRFLGGLTVGASSIVGPIYITEIAPAEKRGRFVILFQLNVVIGILLAYLSNYTISLIVEQNAWRWMLGVQTIPAMIFFISAFALPQSPRWLLMKNEREKAIKILEKMGESNVNELVGSIEDSLRSEQVIKSGKLFTKQLRLPVILAILITFFNQFAGINAIIFYTPRIFEISGLDQTSSLFQSISIGLTNLIFTLLAILFIDSIGRKKLLLIGSVGVFFMLSLVSMAFLFEQFHGILVLIGLVGYIAFFACTLGAVAYVYISEIFPTKVRSKGQALGGFSLWITAALISCFFPIIIGNNPLSAGYAFAFFALIMVLQFFVVYRFFPETKGKSLEQIQHDFGL